MPYYGIDFTYLVLVLPAMLFALYAQSRVKSTFDKYTRVASQKGYTGADVARQLLHISGISDVQIEPTRGHLTDHYDPRKKVLRLSESVYNSRSIAALGVAAHETGHAVQDHVGYSMLRLRNNIAPGVSICSNLALPMIILGLLLNFQSTMLLGIILFSAAVVFHLVTLPVEFDASKRAIAMLSENNYLTAGEVQPAKKVLSAAALTYVASAAVALAQLLRFILIFARRRD